MVSLSDVFAHGEEVSDLAVRPPERVSLMRLLICVAHAALDGPANREDWQTCRTKIAPCALDYLRRWGAAFDLFGSAQRYLQVSGLEKPRNESKDDEGNLVSKLDFALATGNNSTLFDNAGGSERTFTPAEIASMLTTFQCFSPGGRIGIALWNGLETNGKGSSSHAPCLADGMLHALVRGENLLATLHKNLMTKQQAAEFFGKDSWGKPVWESMPDGLHDSYALKNATCTYLGRLVPLARMIWLNDDCRSLILANGLEYPSYEAGWRESSATIVVRSIKGSPKRIVLRASLEKATWRELNALTVKVVGHNPGGPAALQNIPGGEDAFDLWVGGLVSDQSKIVDTTESVFHVPAAMLQEKGQQAYELGVKFAETAEARLRRAVSTYHKEVGDDLDRPGFKEHRNKVQGKSIVRFWTDIEQAVSQLLEVAENPEKLEPTREWRKTDWGQSVLSALRAAYEWACPHETPRQIKAYALGLKRLFSAPAERASVGGPEEVEA
jgi:CRISPR system Cascade subunit CasA